MGPGLFLDPMGECRGWCCTVSKFVSRNISHVNLWMLVVTQVGASPGRSSCHLGTRLRGELDCAPDLRFSVRPPADFTQAEVWDL